MAEARQPSVSPADLLGADQAPDAPRPTGPDRPSAAIGGVIPRRVAERQTSESIPWEYGVVHVEGGVEIATTVKDTLDQAERTLAGCAEVAPDGDVCFLVRRPRYAEWERVDAPQSGPPQQFEEACCDHCACAPGRRVGHDDTCSYGCNDAPASGPS